MDALIITGEIGRRGGEFSGIIIIIGLELIIINYYSYI